MKTLLMMVACGAAAWAQGSLRGTVTDPSGAAVPNATVEIDGGKRAHTGNSGEYSFVRVAAGKHVLKVAAKGFAKADGNVTVNGPTTFDVRLAIQTAPQSISVEERTGGVGTEPESNASAVVMGQREIAALSDDPDELALELQTLAGPAPGPDGGQVYIDGFTGGTMPPKSAIREIRINSNPFAPEFDRPGFARVDIFTKAGSEQFHGLAMTQQNGDALDTRNPLLTTKPPYRSQLYGFDVAGPLRKNRASFTFDLQERKIGDNAAILAATPAGTLNETLPAPQSRTAVSPRVDYALNDRNNLTVRYQQIWNGLDNQGVGSFNLPSQAYHESQREQTVQMTETATLSRRLITETRFQYLRSTLWDAAANDTAAIDVVDAFISGGAPVSDSGNVTGNWEASSLTIYSAGKHSVKWGGRVRDARLTDTSRLNFAGTFTFYTLAQFEAGTPAQFTRNAGTPATEVRQRDAGVFVSDDWRARPNLTFSVGMRYETQSDLGGRFDFAPRAAVAWSVRKIVVRAGAGMFYNRLPLTTTLNRLRYNGETQESYVIFNPAFYPAVPSVESLASGLEPQELRPVAAGLAAPRLYQASVGIERQLNARSRVSLTEIENRGVHLLNLRNINTPVNGAYPFGDPTIRLLTESAGLSWQHQVVADANVQWRGMMLFGYYTLSYGKDDNEGLPADPYNLRAEWGPSAYGDMRHRVALGATVPLPRKWSVSSFFVANSGMPYNITTGLDPEQTGSPTARPVLAGGPCAGRGCFDATPPPGAPTIEHNYGRGPAAVSVALRAARTWQFGREGNSGMSDSGGAGHGGPPSAMFATGGTKRYQVTLSASTLNALNRANFAPPDGDLSSAYFGQYRSLGGLIVMAHGGAPNSFNRKVDVQLQFTF